MQQLCHLFPYLDATTQIEKDVFHWTPLVISLSLQVKKQMSVQQQFIGEERG
jgi:hypothetical protein